MGVYSGRIAPGSWGCKAWATTPNAEGLTRVARKRSGRAFVGSRTKQGATVICDQSRMNTSLICKTRYREHFKGGLSHTLACIADVVSGSAKFKVQKTDSTSYFCHAPW
jgi:hypothetical protein